ITVKFNFLGYGVRGLFVEFEPLLIKFNNSCDNFSVEIALSATLSSVTCRLAKCFECTLLSLNGGLGMPSQKPPSQIAPSSSSPIGLSPILKVKSSISLPFTEILIKLALDGVFIVLSHPFPGLNADWTPEI